MLITFSGLDGSGKSTLIAALRDELERRRRPVTVLHLNDQVNLYAQLRALRSRLARRGRTGRSGAEERSGRLRGWLADLVWGPWLRRLFYPLDLLIFAACRLYLERWRRRILIMDRYFYDTLVDVADESHWRLLRLLERLTPTPDLAVLLDVPPEESRARKDEYPLEYLARRWAAYHTVFPWVRSAVVLPNRDRQTTQGTLIRLVEERLR